MGITDTLGSFGVNISSGAIGGAVSKVGAGFNFFFMVVLVVLVLAVIGIPIYLHFYNKKKYYIKIPFYEENSIGEPVLNAKLSDTASIFKIGTTGDTLIFFKNMKIFKFFPQYSSAKDTFPYCRLRDGSIINFKLGNIDRSRREAGIKLTPLNLRAERASTQDLIKNHYNKTDFWGKYQSMILGIILIAIIVVGGWFIAKKFDSASKNLVTVSENFKLVTESQTKNSALLSASLDILEKNGGIKSGIVPAGT